MARIQKNLYGHYRDSSRWMQLIYRGLRDLRGIHENWFYLPMQKVLKIRFRMSSLVVTPVRASRAVRDS
jgi:hypothetical protein